MSNWKGANVVEDIDEWFKPPTKIEPKLLEPKLLEPLNFGLGLAAPKLLEPKPTKVFEPILVAELNVPVAGLLEREDPIKKSDRYAKQLNWKPLSPEDRELLLWMYSRFTQDRVRPDYRDASKALKRPLLECIKLYKDPEFRKRALLMGIQLVPEDKMLSSEQIYAALVVTDPTDKSSMRVRLGKAGITYATWRGWMRNLEFASLVNSITDALIKDSHNEVAKGLVNAASNGDVSAIKFYYEITGKWDPNAKQQMDVMQVLAQVVEIITKYVTDPVTLDRIGSEMQMLAGLNQRSIGA
jgi:hypothetical protein